ncbi:MAG TPA: CAP domain-containing protein [Candidatus Limnocylindrales bacterium]|nr:CAP domain-containing protein [Candidatus Limnocylindrales bacterium]
MVRPFGASRTVMSMRVFVSLTIVLVFGASSAHSEQGDCGQPASTGEQPVASDALSTLRTAVGSGSCEMCVCDVNDNGAVTASDALTILKAAVGHDIALDCPACATTTTSTTTTTTTTSTTTTTIGEPPHLEGITEAHNEVREDVGVGPLVWSDALAATAQEWADACVDVQAPSGAIDHNPNRHEGHPYKVGENIYAQNQPFHYQTAMDAWEDEKQWYVYETNTCLPTKICGHYTQLVWENTKEVGCATSHCPNLTYDHSIVCNYGPAGNITGQRPY